MKWLKITSRFTTDSPVTVLVVQGRVAAFTGLPTWNGMRIGAPWSALREKIEDRYAIVELSDPDTETVKA